ncbi:SCO2522 family protein [Actinoplanes sp. NBC_00393]|uniref:SCO2522 family protein n=1 Tax=Actinoplanes sp. NBC_00393 TaxID=2975953 RepID=UPI002E21692A
MRAEAEFIESSADGRTESVPLSHLSVELGHFCGSDPAFLADSFRRISPWFSAARDALRFPRPRVSTCFLIDDYFGRPEPPRTLIAELLGAAEEAGMTIDYLVRASGFAEPRDTDPGCSLAELVMARVVEDPPPDTTGARPPVQQSGWLSNGQRSPSPWAPPAENAATDHSIFADIELWNAGSDGRRWSCAMLASVWQLLRLGVLRDHGRRVAVPEPLPAGLPHDWRELPVVSQVSDRAAPFTAYRTMTVCAPLFLPVENAIRTILQQVAIEPAVLGQLAARATAEHLDLPAAVVDRIEYLFVDTGPVRDADSR